VLTAYVREHSPVNVQDAGGDPQNRTTDVQAVLTVLGRRELSHESDPQPWLNLARTNLDLALLNQARLCRAGLGKTSLRATYLVKADLSEAYLGKADLSDADLRHANLRGADLRAANLRGANLTGADVRDAWYDQDTGWPEKFDPRAAGAHHEGTGTEWHEYE
jgi:Pentapeptide repeats (8 copies)